MSVIVKGMEMPKDCRDCRMMEYHERTGNTWCEPADALLADAYQPIKINGRPDWCPLVEVPVPHGRLIEFVEALSFYDDDTGTETVLVSGVVEAYFKMQNAPTVIEAEGEG